MKNKISKYFFKNNYIILSKEKSKTLNQKQIKIVIISFFIIFLLIMSNNKKKDNKLNNEYNNFKKYIPENEINFGFIKLLKNILKIDEIKVNENMNKHTTFRIGGFAKYFIRPSTEKQIIEIIQLCNKYKIPYFILGNGSNLLVSDEGFDGIIIQIKEDNFSELKIIKKSESNYFLIVGGGMLMKTLSIEACLLSLTGLENVIDIPGTVGAGIIMNASFYNKGLRENLIKVRVITPNGKIIELNKNECGFYLRGSMLKDKKFIVIKAIFELRKGDQMRIQKTMTYNTKIRYEKQPIYFGSPGCFFVWEHEKYGSMYKKFMEANLVGYRLGDIMIYKYNVSFIVNLGKGTASQVMKIVLYIEKIMKEKFNIKMRREVIIIGTINNIKYF